jgi:hypothetical protein
VRLLVSPPEQALAFCQQRMAESWRYHQRSVARHQPESAPAALTP